MPRAEVFRRFLWGAALAAWTGVGAAQTVPARIAGARESLPAKLSQTSRHSPDEFGTTDYSVTVIPATSFTSDAAYVTDYGSLARYFPFDSVHHIYFAGLSEIPSGAVIDYIGLECASSANGELTATLWYVDRYSGTTAGIAAVANTPHGFDTDYAGPLGLLVGQNVHNAYVFTVDQVPNSEPLFGWIEIYWRRTVSPPPATPSFADVPSTDFGFQYIEALKSSGITGGCGDGSTFCPDAILTRRQMAIFLAKALGLHWPY